MPSGAKKRKALKKKKQEEAIGTSTNDKGFNGNNLRENMSGQDEHGSQEERGSDSNLSSPGSQGNEEFGTKDPSAAKEISGDADVTHAVERGRDYQKDIAGKSPNSYSENSTKNVPCQDACGSSVLETSEDVETTTHSNLVKQKSDVNEVYPSLGLEKENSKVVTLPGSAAETSQKVDSVREPVPSEEKHLLLPVVRTSWLSCCGLFEAMTGSDR